MSSICGVTVYTLPRMPLPRQDHIFFRGFNKARIPAGSVYLLTVVTRRSF